MADLSSSDGVGLSDSSKDQVRDTELLLLRRQKTWFSASLLQSPDWLVELSSSASESHDKGLLWTIDEDDPLGPPSLNPSDPITVSSPSPPAKRGRSKAPLVDATPVALTDEKKVTIQSTIAVGDGDIRRSGAVSRSSCFLLSCLMCLLEPLCRVYHSSLHSVC